MPHYFFDLYDGPQIFVDNHGRQLRDEAAASKEAATILGEVTRDMLVNNGHHEFRIVVRLAHGDPIWETRLQWETRRFERSEPGSGATDN